MRGGSLFRNLARLSAAGPPVVAVMHGSSTAGVTRNGGTRGGDGRPAGRQRYGSGS